MIRYNKTSDITLAWPYGTHATGGRVVLYERDEATKRVRFISILGRGPFHRAVRVLYAGVPLPEMDGARKQWRFHPGTLSTGFDDPVQGRPEFFPGLELTFSGSAYIEVELSSEMSEGEEEPTQLTVILDTRTVVNYTETGAAHSRIFSRSPALQFADAWIEGFKRKPERLHYPSLCDFRDMGFEGIPWETGTSAGTIDIARYESNVVFAQGTDLPTVLAAIMFWAPGVVWQDVSGKIRFLARPRRRPLYTLIYDRESGRMSNIVANTFSAHKKPGKNRPEPLRFAYRHRPLDVDDPDDPDATFPDADWIEEREKLRTRRKGATVDPGVIPVGVATQSHMQRAAATAIRRETDLFLFANATAQADAYVTAPGDVIEVAHEVPGWRWDRAPLFEITDWTLRSPLTNAEEIVLGLQVYDPDYYSDTKHGPVEPRIATDLPALLPGSIEARARAISALNKLGQYRGRSRGVPDRTKITAIQIADVSYEEMRTEVSVTIYLELTDHDALDTLDGVRVTPLDQYGYLIDAPRIFPISRAGGFAGRIKHTRKYADPLEQSAYQIELHNLHGWSKPVWTSLRPHSAPAIGQDDGAVYLAPPVWLGTQVTPQDLDVLAQDYQTVLLSWRPVAGQTTGLYVRTIGGAFAQFADVAAGTSSLTATAGSALGILAGEAYEFLARNGGIAHDQPIRPHSNIAYVVMPLAPPPPPPFPAPSNLRAKPSTPTKIDLKWSPNSEEVVNVELSVDGGAPVSLGVVTSHQITTSPQTTHVLRVRNGYTSGISVWSHPVSATTPATPSIAGPTGLTGYPEIGDGPAYPISARLFWGQNAAVAPANTFVDYTLGDGNSWATYDTIQLVGAATGVEVTDLLPSAQYQFRVRITGGDFPSNTLVLQTPAAPEPDPYDRQTEE